MIGLESLGVLVLGGAVGGAFAAARNRRTEAERHQSLIRRVHALEAALSITERAWSARRQMSDVAREARRSCDD